MRSRDVVGKTVESIDQGIVSSGYGQSRWTLASISFTDGTVLHLDGRDFGDTQVVDATVTKRPRRQADMTNEPVAPIATPGIVER